MTGRKLSVSERWKHRRKTESHGAAEATSDRIQIQTANGALQACRRPEADYALAYRERIRLVGEDAHKEEVRLRALEAVVNLYRSHHPGVDVDTAKAAVLQALTNSKESA